MTTSIKPPAIHALGSPEEIRAMVQRAQEKGLVSGTAVGGKVTVGKAGEAAAALNKVESKWMEITPKMALNWLNNNLGNRALKWDVVEAYARDMRNGVWVATHQGIAFNADDDLIDGQHRLKAIVESGVTVKMMVTFGLPVKVEGKEELTTMDCVDRGRSRSVADQLTIQHGFKNANITAAICAAMASLCCMERTRKVNVNEALIIFRAFEQPILQVIGDRSKEHGLKAAGVLAGFAFAIAQDGRPVRTMYQALTKGEGLEKLPVIAMLREFLTSPEARLINRSLDRGLSELALQAIHLQMRGMVPEKLAHSVEGATHYRNAQAERVEKIAAMFKVRS
ncbi:MAG: hypothetical protein ACO1QS_16545 [Verrucomicrobiota bacterium]